MNMATIIAVTIPRRYRASPRFSFFCFSSLSLYMGDYFSFSGSRLL